MLKFERNNYVIKYVFNYIFKYVFNQKAGQGAMLMIMVVFFNACSTDQPATPPLFVKVPSDQTKVTFSNDLTYDAKFNIYTYRNFYNGGGVALGDVNNDGLIDIYLTGNQVHNRLYINKGNFTFEDITDKAGVAGTRAWSTGVSMADVNGDGWLDIYVCNSGNVDGDNKENELFINNGDLTFTERAQEYGVADKGYSTHAVFFDYDKDGDLDVYILNNSYQAIGSFNLQKNERGKRDPLGGHKLLRNDNNHFVDVSEQAGIYGSIIAFGLGVTVGDINQDGWQDIYVSNDFFERDYLYMNNTDGTFTECLTSSMKSISGASMGADLSDINNDAYPDLFVTEMLPRSNSRIKTVTTFESWDKYQYNVANDYYHQFTRNMLQVNNQDSTFSDIGRLANVEATDWSWGSLMFDADNDGLKDIFVANGIYKDLTNQDYLQYASSEEFVKSIISKKAIDYQRLIDIIPSNPEPNFIFRNLGNLKFDESTKAWGLDDPSFSNGSAYGDLDNDGDLDLVVNNVNMEAFIYRNDANQIDPQNHYLKFVLQGENKNLAAFGTRIIVSGGGARYYLEQMPIRGFESTVDPRPNFGLGNLERVDKVTVKWPNGKVTELDSVRTNQTLVLRQEDATIPATKEQPIGPKRFKTLPAATFKIDFEHQENSFVDFDRDRLTYSMVSTEGPRISVGDVNGDGLDDFFIGGAKDEPGAMFLQRPGGEFTRSNETLWEKDKLSEDIGSALFDADGDGDMDLYVCSGGNEFSANSSAFYDRLYLNDGHGVFSKSAELLPTAAAVSSSCVRAIDYDKDGDMDLFVGRRLEPFKYGVPMNGYLLTNDGGGHFTDATPTYAEGLLNLGLITDARWGDVDGDGDYDLVVIGEWMPISVFINSNGHLTKNVEGAGLAKSNGWWNAIQLADLDGDGDLDFVAGNLGLNSRFKASAEKPVTMYVSDFDKNGSIEQIICAYNGDKSYPMVLRHDLTQQIPSLKKKYLKYESYKDQTITDIFTEAELKQAIKLEAYQLASVVGINDGQGNFTLSNLPVEAQFSPVYGLEIDDMDRDGKLDVVMSGNLYGVKPEAGRYDASFGTFLKGDGTGRFLAVRSKDSGLFIDGETRDIEPIRIAHADYLLVSRNNMTPVLVKINR